MMKFGSPSTRRKEKDVFGKSLDDLEQTDGVPSILRLLCDHIQDRGFHNEGLFRVGGQKKDIEQLREKLNKGVVALAAVSDVSVLTSVLKLWIRELPSLIPLQYTPQLRDVGRSYPANPMSAAITLSKIVSNLQPVNYKTLRHLSCYLEQVSKQQDANRMGVSQLGIVFGPTVFQSAIDDDLTSIDLFNNVMCCLIGYAENIFKPVSNDGPASSKSLPDLDERSQSPFGQSSCDSPPSCSPAPAPTVRDREFISHVLQKTLWDDPSISADFSFANESPRTARDEKPLVSPMGSPDLAIPPLELPTDTNNIEINPAISCIPSQEEPKRRAIPNGNPLLVTQEWPSHDHRDEASLVNQRIQDVKALKHDIRNIQDSRGDSEANARLANMSDMMDKLHSHLNQKRQQSKRPYIIEEMTDYQIQDEKLAVQKSLLHFEATFGRPATKGEKNLMRPLYDRYRQLKRRVGPTNIEEPHIDNPPPAQPLIRIPSAGHVPNNAENEDRLPLKSGDSLTDLRNKQVKLKDDKKKLRLVLRDFETNFETTRGYKPTREDKKGLHEQYESYKRLKSELHLVETLINKKTQAK